MAKLKDKLNLFDDMEQMDETPEINNPTPKKSDCCGDMMEIYKNLVEAHKTLINKIKTWK